MLDFSQKFFNSRPTVVGHFTQMMVDRSNGIGCALNVFYKDKNYNYLFTCDYSSQNIIGFPIYRRLKTVSECQNFNPDYPGLCAITDNINPNKLLLN